LIFITIKMQHKPGRRTFYLLLKILLLSLFTGIHYGAYSQTKASADSLKADSIRVKQSVALSKQYDIDDLIRNIFHPGKAPDSPHKKSSGITIIPNIASNPTIGSQIGIKAVAGRKLGDDPNTLLSVASTSASITTKGIIYFYINHNVYTPGNKWNLQGNLVIAKTVTPDAGLGIGQNPGGSVADQVLADPERKVRALHSIFFNVREKVYKEVQKNLFVGMGVSFDVRTKIEQKDTSKLTPYNIYSDEHGFKRDNQNRAYKGIYADAGFRVNSTLLASSKSSVQFTTDFRKYFSLSTKNPEHVIAIWNWGSYVISGDVPYLELPGTGKDMNFRSGRGYTSGYFKGTKYNYSEVEYRFPILHNKFVSGVTFINIQTANDEAGTKLFQKWQPGGGGGLRVLFDKTTRTNLCLDYAWGKYGSRGFFLGLNEAF
jgi:hypothetical protein